MTITLQRFATGDTNYISKHNSNCDSLEGAVNALGDSGLQAMNVYNEMQALFGSTYTMLVGRDSYSISGTGTSLTVKMGTVWRPDLGAMLNINSNTVLNFTGQTTGTYYIVADASGTPTIQVAATGAMYSVDWNGSTTLSNHTLIAKVYGAPLLEILAYATTVTIDWRQQDIAVITLTGNITINQDYGVDGQKYEIQLTQDATGSRTLTLGAEARLGTTISSSTLTTTPLKMDRLVFQYHGVSAKYDLVEMVKGY